MLKVGKDTQKELIGKTISSIIIKSRRTEPRSQLILTFTDGTGYEWFSWYGDIIAAKSLVFSSRKELLKGDGAILFDSEKDEG